MLIATNRRITCQNTPLGVVQSWRLTCPRVWWLGFSVGLSLTITRYVSMAKIIAVIKCLICEPKVRLWRNDADGVPSEICMRKIAI